MYFRVIVGNYFMIRNSAYSFYTKTFNYNLIVSPSGDTRDLTSVKLRI